MMHDYTELALVKGLSCLFVLLTEVRKGGLSDQREIEEKQFCGGSLEVPLANTAGHSAAEKDGQFCSYLWADKSVSPSTRSCAKPVGQMNLCFVFAFLPIF